MTLRTRIAPHVHLELDCHCPTLSTEETLRLEIRELADQAWALEFKHTATQLHTLANEVLVRHDVSRCVHCYLPNNYHTKTCPLYGVMI